MKSINRSIERMKMSYIVFKNNPSLIWFPVISGFINLILVAAGIRGIIYIPPTVGNTLQHTYIWAIVFIMLMFVNLVGIFVAGASFSAATTALEGEKATLKRAFRDAWKKRSRLFQWWLFSTGIFLLIALVRAGLEKVLGPLLGRAAIVLPILDIVINTGWAFATIFAVPVIMTHQENPLNSLKLSSGLFKKSWGENVTGDAGFFIIGFLTLTLAGVLTTVVNYAIFRIDPNVNSIIFGVVYGIIAGTSVGLVALASSITHIIFNASLYRYAETGDFVGPLKPDMIKEAFGKTKKPRFL
jgi:hypothetical protein